RRTPRRSRASRWRRSRPGCGEPAPGPTPADVRPRGEGLGCTGAAGLRIRGDLLDHAQGVLRDRTAVGAGSATRTLGGMGALRAVPGRAVLVRAALRRPG